MWDAWTSLWWTWNGWEQARVGMPGPRWSQEGMGILGRGQAETGKCSRQDRTAVGMFRRNTDMAPEDAEVTQTGKSGPTVGMSEASPAAGGCLAQVRLSGRGPRAGVGAFGGHQG